MKIFYIVIFLLCAAAGYIYFEYKENASVPREVRATNNLNAGIKRSTPLKWGAFVEGGDKALADFEYLVGKPVDIAAVFKGWNESFPTNLKQTIGEKKKTLLVFWEPQFGYDHITNGSKDTYIKKFAADAKSYGYPVILVPFPEMNLNEEDWGYGQNNNTAVKFKKAWVHVRNLFANAKNVKFGLAYNNVSIPDIGGNSFADYYPGDQYVDYAGVDGFNFNDPPQTFEQIFDDAMKKLVLYRKPIYIFSMASAAGPNKSQWITNGLGRKVKEYPDLAGWIWFNQDGNPDWTINSDSNSLKAFKAVIP